MPDTSLQSLRQPQKLQDTLAKQQAEYDDCTPCRLMGMDLLPRFPHLLHPTSDKNGHAGSAAFTGLGIYTYGSGMSQLRKREVEIANQVAKTGSRFGLGARKVSILGLSAGLVGAGVYRLVN